MALKQDLIYSRGRSMSVAPSRRLIDMLDDEKDLEYVPLGTWTPTLVAIATWSTF